MFEKKKRITIAIVTVVVIAIIAIIAMNLATSAKNQEITKLDEITSPDNKYMVVINQVGYPISFDSHNVKIQLIDNKTNEEIYCGYAYGCNGAFNRNCFVRRLQCKKINR